MRRLGRLLYHGRWWTLAIGFLLVIAAAVYGGTLFGVLKSGGFNDPASPSYRARLLLDRKFSGARPEVIVLLHSHTWTATQTPFSQAANRLLGRLKSQPQVASVTSYYSTHQKAFLSRNLHETFAVVQLKPRGETAKEKAYEALAPLITSPSPSIQVQVGGLMPTYVALNQQVESDLKYAEMLTLPIVALLLVIVFGGLVAAMLPLLIGVVAILGSFAILRVLATLTGISVFAVNVVTMLGLGLAVDYALFILSRFREELVRSGQDREQALQETLATAGRTVLFSGLTVSTSLSGLLLFPGLFLRSMGMGAIAAVLVAMFSALTLLPALLAVLGQRVNALSLVRLWRRVRPAVQQSGSESGGVWYRLAQAVMRWPIPVMLGTITLLVVLGAPFRNAVFSIPDARTLPPGSVPRVVAGRLARDFPSQGASHLEIAVRTPGDARSPRNLASLSAYVNAIRGLPGVVQVNSLVTVSPSLTLMEYQRIYSHPAIDPALANLAGQMASGNLTEVTVAMRPQNLSPAAVHLVQRIRAISAPGGLRPLVDGTTAEQIDIISSLKQTIPVALLVVVTGTILLLFLMTGSLVVPLTAVIVGALSLSASFGALVWIFQYGHFQQLLAFRSIGSVDATQPILIFAVAFGLSLDYEVFLLSRIKERFDATGDNRLAVASGLERTGWLITSAAILLAVVFGAFSSSRILFIKEIGVGLCIAVIMDATLVRGLLVPATMRLLGRLNWWAPSPLKVVWQKIGLSEAPYVLGPGSSEIEPD